MLHQVALYTSGPLQSLRERSRNGALPGPWDADDQDDHGLVGYLGRLGDHEKDPDMGIGLEGGIAGHYPAWAAPLAFILTQPGGQQ